MTLAQAHENLASKGFTKPLDPTPMPNPIPPTWNLNEYCYLDMGDGSKPTEPKGKDEKKEEYRVLTQIKKTQAYISV